MIAKLIPTGISVAIGLSKKELLDILEKDKYNKTPLYERLEKISQVSNVDYDGLFGPYVYMDISINRKIPKKVERKILGTISRYLQLKSK